jgi:acetyl-CoA acetyltransferase
MKIRPKSDVAEYADHPSGGLLVKGHPVGASGVGQIAKIVCQLRGHAEKRQIEGAACRLYTEETKIIEERMMP